MMESRKPAAGEIEPESQSDRQDDRGIDTTSGEPNPFKPDDPDAATKLVDKTVELFG